MGLALRGWCVLEKMGSHGNRVTDWIEAPLGRVLAEEGDPLPNLSQRKHQPSQPLHSEEDQQGYPDLSKESVSGSDGLDSATCRSVSEINGFQLARNYTTLELQIREWGLLEKSKMSKSRKCVCF